MKYKVLIVEDEAKFAYILERYFLKDGFDVVLAFDGASGYKSFVDENPDVVCLDIMLPVIDGYEVARRIRTDKNTPIVMMSALDEEQDVKKGLACRIDWYVTKPLQSTAMFVAQVRNLLERRKDIVEERIKDNEIEIGEVKIIRDVYQCYLRGELVNFSKTEFVLLEYLMLHAGENCKREDLFALLCGEKDIKERIIDTYIKKIRKMLSPHDYITTVFKIGYRFEKDTNENKTGDQ